MLANPESAPESIEQFGGSDSDYSVPDVDMTSLVEEPPSDAEFFEEPVPKKGKGKQKVKGDTRAMISSKRESVMPKTDTDRDVIMGDTEDDAASKRKRALLKLV